jgi:hypothetical protein
LTQNMNDTLNISYAENRPFRQNKPNAGFWLPVQHSSFIMVIINNYSVLHDSELYNINCPHKNSMSDITHCTLEERFRERDQVK